MQGEGIAFIIECEIIDRTRAVIPSPTSASEPPQERDSPHILALPLPLKLRYVVILVRLFEVG